MNKESQKLIGNKYDDQLLSSHNLHRATDYASEGKIYVVTFILIKVSHNEKS